MPTLICKHCSGQHLTFKCPNKKTKPPLQKNKKVYTKKKYNPVTVMLSNLPDDITFTELSNLMKEWGAIKNINLKYNNAFITFNFKNEGKYFVEAIDKTPFDNLILNAKILEN